MSTAGDAFNLIKRILLINEDMARLSASVDRLNTTVSQHEIRLIRLETLAEMSPRPRRAVLPGE